MGAPYATSIATGHKTESGVINMCPWTRDVPYETIAEKLHAQKNYKVGVVSTVNIDHATPAAFYAHQKTRKNYYAIGKELAVSGFEYFAGGEFQKVNGDGTGPNNHEIAAQNGYNVVTRQADAAALKAGAGKTLIIAEALADGKAMNYAMDAAAGEWQLTDYVKKGIELLDNKKGFFLMTESGKIDWACHANDAAASIHDVLEMSNAVQTAVDFYNAHPNDTLIPVSYTHLDVYKRQDLARVDEDGFYYITGRKKNIIILDNGENVSPEELENLLSKCEAVKECIFR